MKVLFKEFITVWTRGLVSWLSRKFDSISIDLTPVEEKLDDVKSDVADVKTAVENIDIDTSDLAKESTLATIGSNASTDFSIIKDAVKKNGTSVIDAVNYNIQQVSSQQGYLQNTTAKEATLGAAPIGSDKSTVFQYLAAIYDSIVGTVSPDVPEGVADRLAAVMKFFGIYVDGDKVYVRGADPEHSEQIVPAEFMTDSEVCDELEDIMQLIDPNLTAAQAAAITAQTLNNPSES